MHLAFDLTEEELPIFQAEAEEQLQVLEKGIVYLEHDGENPELVQTLFRAAHTLKGSAGMIGHKRMVSLTHALESVLDSVRKTILQISPEIIDACLESLDCMISLCEEVTTGKSSPVEITPIVQRLHQFVDVQPTIGIPQKKIQDADHSEKSSLQHKTEKYLNKGGKELILIHAKISPDSIASAARAFQIVMALQELGEIQSMEPPLEVIETASPVTEYKARLLPTKPLDEIKKALSMVAEIDQLTIGDENIKIKPEINQSVHDTQPEKAKTPLGEMLIKQGLITKEQLHTALEKQEEGGPAAPLGQILVSLNYINQEVLDEIISEQNRQGKNTSPDAAVTSREQTSTHSIDKTIRTNVERLDNLMNLVGELITDRNRLFQLRRELEETNVSSNEIEDLSGTITHVGRITDLLQAELMSVRMLPISNVFNKFPRLVRDLARSACKNIDLVIRGENTELDRSVIEEISDPLIHLIRNSVDHGIETPEERENAGKPERGIILLTARHEQGRIIITVEDNGRGIDIERVKAKAVEKGQLTRADADVMKDKDAIDLIFLSGLSTARKVSDVSGRGVGMDIVHNNIELLSGNILVETWQGRGTKFSIILPLTLAIVPTLLVLVNGITYAIPLVTVNETLRIKVSEIQTVNGKKVILLRNTVLPVNYLSEILDLNISPNGHKNEDYVYVVVVRSGKSMMGLIVDSLIGEQDVVVKSISTLVGEVSGISSAAILGDGQVALIIDVGGLVKLATSHAGINMHPELTK
jgi:two-component system chemotaxis sensor kinase CheA